MSIQFLSNDNNAMVLEIHIPLGTVMTEGEQCIERGLMRQEASGELLKRFDTDGSDIQISDAKLTSKGQIAKTYQTPYDETRVNRHIYQKEPISSLYCRQNHH